MSLLKKLLTSVLVICSLVSITTTNPYTYTIKNSTGTGNTTDVTIGQVTIPVYEEKIGTGKYALTIPTGEEIKIKLKLDYAFSTGYTDEITVAPGKDGTINGKAAYCFVEIKVNGKTFQYDLICSNRTITVTGISPNLKIDVSDAQL